MEKLRSEIIKILNRLKDLNLFKEVDKALVDKLLEEQLKIERRSELQEKYGYDPHKELVDTIKNSKFGYLFKKTKEENRKERSVLYRYMLEKLKYVYYDPECIYNYQEDYPKLISKIIPLAEILKDIKIQVSGDITKKENPVISIRFNKKEYKAELEYHMDYADNKGLLNLLNNILRSTDEKRRFYHFIGDEVFFMTEEQSNILEPFLSPYKKPHFL